MRVTIPWIKANFDRFNEEIFSKLQIQGRFSERLPLPHFKLTSAKSFLAQHKKREVVVFGKKVEEHTLTFSVYHQQISEREWEDTVIHEMIHYWQSYFKMTDPTAHGKIFRHLMNEINRNFHRNISISHRTFADSSDAGQQENDDSPSRLRIHNILTLKSSDGRQCVCFLTRGKMFDWYDELKKSGKYSDIRLFRTGDSLFNRYRHPKQLTVFICPDIHDLLEQANVVVEMKRTSRGFEPI